MGRRGHYYIMCMHNPPPLFSTAPRYPLCSLRVRAAWDDVPTRPGLLCPHVTFLRLPTTARLGPAQIRSLKQKRHRVRRSGSVV